MFGSAMTVICWRSRVMLDLAAVALWLALAAVCLALAVLWEACRAKMNAARRRRRKEAAAARRGEERRPAEND